MSKLKCLNCSVREEAVEGLYGDVDILEPHLDPLRSPLPPRHLRSAPPSEPTQCDGSRWKIPQTILRVRRPISIS